MIDQAWRTLRQAIRQMSSPLTSPNASGDTPPPYQNTARTKDEQITPCSASASRANRVMNYGHFLVSLLDKAHNQEHKLLP